MHESPSNHENNVPLVSLVNEAYGEILKHNKGCDGLGTLIVDMMRAVMAAEKAESAGGDNNFDDDFQNNLSYQSDQRKMEADIQYLRHSDILADAGVWLASKSGSTTIISGSKDIAIGGGALYPVVLGSSEDDVNKFVDYVSALRPDDDIQLVVDVLETTSATIWDGCKSLYSDDSIDADKAKIYDVIREEVEKFMRIDQAADNIKLAELLPRRCEDFEKAAHERTGNQKTLFPKDRIELYRREDAVAAYRRLERYVGYYAQNVLPEYLFLGDADRESLKDSLLSNDAGPFRGNMTKEETAGIVRVITANRSPEAVDYALRYAQNFEIGLEKTLDELLEVPEADRPYYQIGDDKTNRAYESVVRECLGALRQARNNAEVRKFDGIVANFDQQ